MTYIDDVLERTGCTYRQLDYWTVTGRLSCLFEGRNANRRWPALEIEVARIMRRLVDAGLDLQAAHDAARQIAVRNEAVLAPGVRVTVT